jgi:amino acid adenylation domain-containing protein/non-ribosomal peptide synthase protein (TIGR01720 family)
MFVLQNTPVQGQDLPGLTLRPVESHSGTAKFDLTLFMVEEPDSLQAVIEYNTDLFDAATIERLAAHYTTLLQAAVAAPDQPLITLPLLSEAERHRLLVEWNATDAPFPTDQCVHHLVAAEAARTPEALALVCGGTQLTYADLDARANQLAHLLQQHDVGPDTLVGISAERSIELIVGILGILKAGGAYVPLDPAYPAERLAFMLADAQAPAVLTQAALVEHLTPHSATVIALDAPDTVALLAQQPATPPASGVTPTSLAYCIYTSGSTGQPKGVLIEHRGVVNYLTWCQRAYPLGVGSGAPVHSSIAFDLTVTSLFAPLVSGRTVHLLAGESDVELLGTALADTGDFSLVKLTPAHLTVLRATLPPAAATRAAHALVIGGEALHSETLDFWQQHAPQTRLFNEYGPTETVVGCCVYECPPDQPHLGPVPIGRPIINTQLYILDTQQQPVPIGVTGELYIGGAGVARGYHNRPDLTAERFVPDPFSNEPGARLYRTGDRARYRADGVIEFLGRVDQQVKLHGFRIELDEIVSVLQRHAAVTEATVVLREDHPGAKRLVAYVVAAAGHTLDTEALRTHLRQTVPEYMIPAAFVELESLPLTTNGKVDRKALPAPAAPISTATSDTDPTPQTAIEHTLAAIWQEVLGLDTVSIHDNFFELGGDSILSIQIVARATQNGLHLSPRDVFQAPTIAQQAAVASTAVPHTAEQGIITGEVPLTPIQHWFFAQQFAEPHHWNQALLLEIQTPLDGATLQAALEHVVAHHDALRLRFTPTAQGWQQTNYGLNDTSVSVQHIDLSGLGEAEQQATIETLAAQAQTRLNLEQGPLLHATSFSLDVAAGSRLLLVAHHLVVDGVSWRILLEDLHTAYEQLQAGRGVQLPLKTTSFQQWAQRLVAYAQKTDTAQHELAYWLGLPWERYTPLPCDMPDGNNSEASGESVTITLSAAETHALLHEVPAAFRTEIIDVLLTALVEAYASLTGSRSMLVDLEGHGREPLFDDVNVSRTVGWFTSLYPVMLDLEHLTEPESRLQAVKEYMRQIPQRGIGYGILRYLCDDPDVVQQLRTLPRADMAFNYLGQFGQEQQDDSPFAMSPHDRGPDRSLTNQRTHLLDVTGVITGGQLQLEWTYSANVHQHATIERMAQAFLAELKAIIERRHIRHAGHYTAEDVAEFGWDAQDLADILAAINNQDTDA